MDDPTPIGVTLHSPSNDRRIEHWVWCPERSSVGAQPWPMLLLLHGVYDSASCWWQKGGAHVTAHHLVSSGSVPPFVLVMAGDTGASQGSGYLDWHDGTCAAETYLLDELLPWCDDNLPVAGAERWIAGLSMGGFGALSLALRRPGTFASASAMSGFFDPVRLFDFVPDAAPRMWGTGGGEAEFDVRRLVANPARRAQLRLAFDCGTEDPLREESAALHRELVDLEVSHEYATHPGGHDWDYWSSRLPDHIRFHAGAA